MIYADGTWEGEQHGHRFRFKCWAQEAPGWTCSCGSQTWDFAAGCVGAGGCSGIVVVRSALLGTAGAAVLRRCPASLISCRARDQSKPVAAAIGPVRCPPGLQPDERDAAVPGVLGLRYRLAGAPA